MIRHGSDVVTNLAHHADTDRKVFTICIAFFTIPELVKISSDLARTQFVCRYHIGIICPRQAVFLVRLNHKLNNRNIRQLLGMCRVCLKQLTDNVLTFCIHSLHFRRMVDLGSNRITEFF